jgi:uncharacterized protein
MNAAVSPFVWSQSLNGRALNLLEPDPKAIDFEEVARTLAGINRFAGAAEAPVNVALHTLIAAECAPASLRPWILLHDAHEYALGDWTTPVKRALCSVADEIKPGFGVGVGVVFQRLAYRHDCAIHAAAGVPMPSADQTAAIHVADLRALRTERDRFCARPPLAWAPAVERAEPLARFPSRWLRRRPAVEDADELLAAFRAALPALRKGPRP